MRIGTKSVLFGIHSPPIHSFFMGLAWLKLYGFSREFLDPRLHLCFWLHDIGYWNCKEMDGEDGELHPAKGAEIVSKITQSQYWQDMCMYHSATMVDKCKEASSHCKLPYKHIKPSKLYPVDKLASTLYPKWLYKLLSSMSGEWKEYAEIQFGGRITGWTSPGWLILTDMEHKTQKIVTFEDWHTPAMKYMRERAYRFVESESWETMKEGMKKNETENAKENNNN